MSIACCFDRPCGACEEARDAAGVVAATAERIELFAIDVDFALGWR